MYQFEKNTMHRIDNFMGRLVHKYYKVIGDLNCTAYITREPVRYEDRFTGEKKDLKAGDHWGDLFDCAWMHFTGEIPAESQGENLVLLIDVSGEGLCYDEKRGPLTGLTHGSVVHEFGSVRKHVVPLDLLGTKDGFQPSNTSAQRLKYCGIACLYNSRDNPKYITRGFEIRLNMITPVVFNSILEIYP